MNTFPVTDDNTFLIGLAGGLLLLLVSETVGVICFICKVVYSPFILFAVIVKIQNILKRSNIKFIHRVIGKKLGQK